eukprot:scaffold36753_cov41-Cyclotella_meneghiniana.AAC.1
MNSNINLVPSFIILVMRHWKGQVAVKWLLYQSKPTPDETLEGSSCCEIVCTNPNPHHHGVKLGSRAKIVPTLDSKISLLDETLEGSSCCEMDVPIQTHTILTMNSNINLVPSFIILVMRHWKGQAAVKWFAPIQTRTIM